ncbi:MAG: hypothetical protein GXP17_08390 [Gammaproteobacteria bacterium]|nr:hypothetical protein [Gammaproteobacteria bacterium]
MNQISLSLGYNNEVVEIAHGEVAEFYLNDPIKISLGKTIFEYEPWSKGRIDYHKYAYGNRKEKFNMQFENSGKIYIVEKNALFPVKELPSQPYGFPFQPNE